VREPIAIVGIACRLPGGIDSAEELASLLVNKQSAIGEVPADRWDRDAFFHPDFRKPGYLHIRRGGFVPRIDEFDAAFFGISPNEAKRMDPQQRMVLELAYSAFEDAGTRLDQLAGKRVAVTVGCGLSDYGGLTSEISERQNIAGASNPGSAISIIANRISYLFDLRGPSFTVDTACSSALTALHLACQSIWDGTSEAALTGGVNAILKPEITLGFSKGGYLSPDGVCRAFSDDANGYVRSEGGALVLLKPLARAVADGDRIYALIRNTWLNQDGHTSGMTVPSQPQQEELIRMAFEGAGIDPARACYIEAHGTGTPAGDPIEATAIGRVVGQAPGRTEPCYFGSVKTNVGHMEFVAGMAGLMKLALVLRRREVLPNINFRRANPKLDLEALGLRIATDRVPLPQEGPLFGGVNSFGFGGANGHVVLESPPAARAPKTLATVPATVAAKSERLVSASSHERVSGGDAASASDKKERQVLVLSARSQTALGPLATAIAERLRDESLPLEELSQALLTRRSRFEFRAAVVGATRAELGDALEELARTATPGSNIIIGRAREDRTEKIGFVFTGQGAQWFAMGRSLGATNATFRGVVERVESELLKLGWLADEKSTLRAELGRDKATSRMGETQIAQPCLFALQVGVATVLSENGIKPAAVAGHSIGELAAAVASEALTLEEATRIVFWRSRCQAAAEGAGAMAAVGVTPEEARALVARHEGRAEIAAINGPTAITLAGTKDAIESIVRELEAKDVFCRRLDISVPFHCWLMDPIEASFRTGLGKVDARPSKVAFFSTVTGGALADPLDLDYWWRNIRAPVAYADALKAMAKSGIACFVEVGPHPALMHGSVDTLREQGTRATYLPTLRRDGDDDLELARLHASLFVTGAQYEGKPTPPTFVDLPRYPFERQRFWLETEEGSEARRYPVTRVHPHIGRIERSAFAEGVFHCQLILDPRVEPYIAEHRAQGHMVFPAAGQSELVIAAARHIYGTSDIVVEDIQFRRPMVVASDEEKGSTFRLEIYADDGHYIIASRVGEGTEASWVEHSRGRIRRSRNKTTPRFDLEDLRARTGIEVSTSDRYRGYQRAGLALGPAFHGVVRSWRNATKTETLAEVVPPPAIANERGRFVIHPALLDAAVQVGMPIDPERGDSQQMYLPWRAGEIRFFGPVPEGRIWAFVEHRTFTREEASADVHVMDEDGVVFLRFTALAAHVINGPTSRFGSGLVYDHAWRPSEASAGAPRAALGSGSWLVLTSPNVAAVGRAVEQKLGERGRRVIRVLQGAAFVARDNDVFEVRPSSAEDMTKLVQAVGEPISGLVHLWSCDADPSSSEPALDAVRTGALPLGHLITAIGNERAWAPGREAWLVTQGASVVVPGERPSKIGAATTLGFGRVLMSEQPRITTTLVELDGDLDAAGANLAAEIGNGPTDPEVAFRGGSRFVRTLTRADELKLPKRTFDVKQTAIRAVVRTPGVLDSVALEETHLRDLQPDEVELSVRAAGLNFRDVVAAMNLLPKAALEGGFIGANQLGSDAAGIITRVGSAVTHVAPGDRAFGYFKDCITTRVIGTAEHVAKISPDVSFEDAATLPLAFLTVEAAFEDLAQLKAGETVLIHAAAGGVGCIAVQMALHLGATVIATTSSEEKRAFLRSLGVKHIFNSRTPDFGDEILELTNGRGVDVVLNSLSGPALTESLRCLRSFGRFVEIGKTDVYKNRQLGLSGIADNKSYLVLDANRFLGRKRADALFERMMRARTSGMISTLPVRTFSMTETAEALRCLAQGKQIGKVVIQMPSEGTLEADASTELRLDPAGVYLVTGGCAGFGLAVAEWLAIKGAKNLVLAGRRGLPGDEEKAQVAALRERGVRVEVRSADISVHADVTRLLDDARTMGRLAGIYHAATTLDDAPFGALDERRYAGVLAAKAQGAYLLHQATTNDALDHFVLFSSIASVVGTPGQASYAAANTYLDELAGWRRSLGLPATSVNWGVIDDVGMVARAPIAQRQKILGRGVCSLPSDRALEILERMLLEGSTRRVVADFDTQRLTLIGGARRRFAALIGQEAEEGGSGDGESVRAQLLQAPEDTRVPLLTSALASVIARISGLGDKGIDVETSLSRYGFDSLMIAQLQTWIEEQLGVTIPMVHLMRGPTTTELAKDLIVRASEAARGSADAALLKPLAREAGARFALVCFPPMGMGGEVFAPFEANLPDDVALYVLELPVFGGPGGQVLTRTTEEQHAALVEALDALGTMPYAFYGHSMGAYIALEVARSLRAQSRQAPRFIALAAVPIPEAVASLVPEGIETPEEITDVLVEAAIAKMNGGDGSAAPTSVKERVRRDLWVTVRGRAEGRLSVAVTPADEAFIVGGSDDPLTTIEKLPPETLRELGHSAPVIVPGPHLFLLTGPGRDAAFDLMTPRIAQTTNAS
jgi:acyl transferase domain-containing protein/surfactin synthase thioesterase subunit/NAD(P)-dependent dehydrogenase (short-subunit alcohol dehydrogenase family)/acyl carrier protein